MITRNSMTPDLSRERSAVLASTENDTATVNVFDAILADLMRERHRGSNDFDDRLFAPPPAAQAPLPAAAQAPLPAAAREPRPAAAQQAPPAAAQPLP